MPTTPFDSEHEVLRDSARRLVEGPLRDMAAAAEAGGTPHAQALARVAELSVTGSGDVLAEIVVAEELGRLASAGLVGVVLDTALAADLGVDVDGPVAIARDTSVTVTGGTATGRLPFVPAALVATRCLVVDSAISVRLEDASVAALDGPHALRGAAPGSVALEATPAEPVVIDDDVLHRHELLHAAAVTGGARRTWEQAMAYARQREAFGRPIASFQVNRHALADLATKLTAAEALVHETGWLWSCGETTDPAAVRLYAGSVAAQVADRALQLHGGYGYTTDFDAQRAWRDAHAVQLGDERRRRRLTAEGTPA